jgi:hypothetical protein
MKTLLPVVALSALISVLAQACGGQNFSERRTAPALAERAATRAIELDGLGIEIPLGWDGYLHRVGPGDSQPVIWVANVPFVEQASNGGFPHATLEQLPPTGIVIEAVAAPATGPRRSLPFTGGTPAALKPPLALADGYFLATAYEGQPSSHVSTQIIEGQLGGRSIYVQVYFGSSRPAQGMRDDTDAVLASVSLQKDRQGRVGSAGITVELPSGWHTTIPDDGNVTNPVTRLVVASGSIHREPRGCQVSDYSFPSDAVELVVVERRDPRVEGRGAPRPPRFTADDLPLRPPPAIECFDGPGGSAQFIERGRTFGAYILLGPDARAELGEAARVALGTLKVDPHP